MLNELILKGEQDIKEQEYRNFLAGLAEYIKFEPGTTVTVSNPQKTVSVDNLTDLIKAIGDKSSISVDNFPASFEVSNLDELKEDFGTLGEQIKSVVEGISNIKLEIPSTQKVEGTVEVDQKDVVSGIKDLSKKIDTLNESISLLEMSPVINITPNIEKPDLSALQAEIRQFGTKIEELLTKNEEEDKVEEEKEEVKIVSLNIDKDKLGNVRKITEVYSDGSEVVTDGLNMDKIRFSYD